MISRLSTAKVTLAIIKNNITDQFGRTANAVSTQIGCEYHLQAVMGDRADGKPYVIPESFRGGRLLGRSYEKGRDLSEQILTSRIMSVTLSDGTKINITGLVLTGAECKLLGLAPA